MSEPSLTSIVARTVRRLAAVETMAGTVWGVLAAVVTLLIAAWLDLLWELAPSGRVAAWGAAAAAAAVVFAARVSGLFRTARRSAVARRLDRAADSGGVILSGWKLLPRPEQGNSAGGSLARTNPGLSPSRGAASAVLENSPHAERRALTTAGLAGLAVEHAARLAAGVPAPVAVPLQPFRRACTICGVAALVIALAAVALPVLSRTQWLRFTQPWADIPPYSRIRFQVTPGDVQVVYAAPLSVRVEVAGGTPERIELVYVNAGQEEVLPMFPEAAGTFQATLARIIEPSRYYVRAERARTRRFNVEVITVPRIESVQFRIRPPDYTHDAEYQGPLPKNGIQALAGTRVEVQAISNRPLSGGNMSIAEEGASRSVAMQPVPGQSHTARGSFEVASSGRFELRLVDVAGQPSQEVFAGTITLLHDQRPLVRLLEPRGVSLATPTAILPVTVSAEDDYGILGADLYRSLNNSRPLPAQLPAGSPPPRRLQERTYLPLGEYGLSPGDEIKMFARVEDNDPAGTKGAESTVVTVRIISQEEFDRMLRVRQGVEALLSKYQQVQRRLEALAHEMEELQEKLAAAPADSALSQALQEELDRLADEMRQHARALDELSRQSLPFDADQNLSKHLGPLAQALEEGAQALQELAAAPGSSCGGASQQLAELAKRLRGERDDYQRQAMEPLEHLRLVYPLMEDQSRFVLLAVRQRDLAERLAALKGRGGDDDPALRVRMRDLEDQQRKTRDELNELLDDIEQHAAALPDREELHELQRTAREFSAAVRASGAAARMAGAEAALAEFAGTDAYEHAAEAADILESFLSKCQGMGEEGQACLAFQPGWSEALGDTVNQLLAEAGLGLGTSGVGVGGGGGYSAMRSTLSNVGLYGALPTLGPAGSGEGITQQGIIAAGSPGLLATGSGDLSPRHATPDGGSAAGAVQGSIPARYRQRVGQYFQRITEESEP